MPSLHTATRFLKALGSGRTHSRLIRGEGCNESLGARPALW